MNSRLGMEKSNLLSIILDYGSRSSIIPGKNRQIPKNKMTKTVCWSAKGGEFNSNYTSEVEIVLPKSDGKNGDMQFTCG